MVQISQGAEGVEGADGGEGGEEGVVDGGGDGEMALVVLLKLEKGEQILL